MAIKDDLRALRERLGFTQTEMADAMGLSYRAYSDLENKETARVIHILAAERVALQIAAQRDDGKLLPRIVRSDIKHLIKAEQI